MSTNCLGCSAKGEERLAVTVIAVGHRAWDLCNEHAQRFSGYLAELFTTDGAAPTVRTRGSVVVTGTIPGYEPEAASRALENSGFTIFGHVNETTEFIVCGIRPVPHKVREAREAGTASLDATIAGRFKDAVASGRWVAEDALPEVVEKRTAEEVRAQVEREERWREEKSRRLEASRVEWARECAEKEKRETRRLVEASLPPELSEAEKVRQWAREHGFTVSSKGRVPAHVRVAYAKAQEGQEALSVVSR